MSRWLRTTKSVVQQLVSSSIIFAAVYAPVAQLDRVGGFEPLGREFESLRVRHTKEPSPKGGGFFIWRLLTAHDRPNRKHGLCNEFRHF